MTRATKTSGSADSSAPHTAADRCVLYSKPVAVVVNSLTNWRERGRSPCTLVRRFVARFSRSINYGPEAMNCSAIL